MTQNKSIKTAVNSLHHTGWFQSPRLKWSSSWGLPNSWDHEHTPLRYSQQPLVTKDLLHLILLAIPWHAYALSPFYMAMIEVQSTHNFLKGTQPPNNKTSI